MTISLCDSVIYNWTPRTLEEIETAFPLPESDSGTDDGEVNDVTDVTNMLLYIKELSKWFNAQELKIFQSSLNSGIILPAEVKVLRRITELWSEADKADNSDFFADLGDLLITFIDCGYIPIVVEIFAHVLNSNNIVCTEKQKVEEAFAVLFIKLGYISHWTPKGFPTSLKKLNTETLSEFLEQSLVSQANMRYTRERNIERIVALSIWMTKHLDQSLFCGGAVVRRSNMC